MYIKKSISVHDSYIISLKDNLASQHTSQELKIIFLLSDELHRAVGPGFPKTRQTQTSVNFALGKSRSPTSRSCAIPVTESCVRVHDVKSSLARMHQYKHKPSATIPSRRRELSPRWASLCGATVRTPNSKHRSTSCQRCDLFVAQRMVLRSRSRDANNQDFSSLCDACVEASAWPAATTPTPTTKQQQQTAVSLTMLPFSGNSFMWSLRGSDEHGAARKRRERQLRQFSRHLPSTTTTTPPHHYHHPTSLPFSSPHPHTPHATTQSGAVSWIKWWENEAEAEAATRKPTAAEKWKNVKC